MEDALYNNLLLEVKALRIEAQELKNDLFKRNPRCANCCKRGKILTRAEKREKKMRLKALKEQKKIHKRRKSIRIQKLKEKKKKKKTGTDDDDEEDDEDEDEKDNLQGTISIKDQEKKIHELQSKLKEETFLIHLEQHEN